MGTQVHDHVPFIEADRIRFIVVVLIQKKRSAAG
jgi:hypothetical protein